MPNGSTCSDHGIRINNFSLSAPFDLEDFIIVLRGVIFVEDLAYFLPGCWMVGKLQVEKSLSWLPCVRAHEAFTLVCCPNLLVIICSVIFGMFSPGL